EGPDQAGVPGADALVDDAAVEAGQVQRGDRRHELERDDGEHPGAVGPGVGQGESEKCHAQAALAGRAGWGPRSRLDLSPDTTHRQISGNRMASLSS